MTNQKRTDSVELKYITNAQTIYVWADHPSHRFSGTFLKRDNPLEFDTLMAAINANDVKAVTMLISTRFNIVDAINAFGDGRINFDGSKLYYLTNEGDKAEIDSNLTKKIRELVSVGASSEILIRFLDNLMQNPDKRAISDFYDFLVVNNLAITEDGHFIAYKIVRKDFKDLYTGTMDNSPKTTVKVDRSEVDPDPLNPCSHGLHICSKDYLPQYGGFYGKSADSAVVVVKVNPKDVVAFPKDYRHAKCRVCEYYVVEQFADLSRGFLNQQIEKLESGITIDIAQIERLLREIPVV